MVMNFLIYLAAYEKCPRRIYFILQNRFNETIQNLNSNKKGNNCFQIRQKPLVEYLKSKRITVEMLWNSW